MELNKSFKALSPLVWLAVSIGGCLCVFLEGGVGGRGSSSLEEKGACDLVEPEVL